jgi:hypothetical protein
MGQTRDRGGVKLHLSPAKASANARLIYQPRMIHASVKVRGLSERTYITPVRLITAAGVRGKAAYAHINYSISQRGLPKSLPPSSGLDKLPSSLRRGQAHPYREATRVTDRGCREGERG